MKENKFRNTETMKAVADIITAQKEFCELYSLTKANMNTNVEQSNRVTVIAENVELSRELIDTAKLQNDFFNAVSRITVWVDSNAIVVFVGAVFAVHAQLAESDKKEQFSQLFKESRDEKYNERTLRKKVITMLTETRHTFDSIDTFREFFSQLAELVTARKTALSQTDSTAKKDSKKEQSAKKDSKAKNSKKDMSKVSTEQITELTKEIIESEMRAQ